MSDKSTGNGEGADVIERVRAYVVDLGRRAVELCELYDFGFPSSVVRDHIARLGRDFDSFRGAFEVPELASGGRGSLWDHEQSVRYAAGAAMITARFRGAMSPANIARAAAAKALHEFQADLLDDIIDGGAYTFEEARSLYRMCLAPMTEADHFDPDELRMELRRRIQAHQQGTVDLLTSLTARLHDLLRHAPNWDAFRSEIRRENERLATGQALTVFQKRESRSIRIIRGWASRFPAPHPDLAWQERFARSVAHGSGLCLIDLCFAEERLTPSELRSHLNAWYYFDVLMTLVNNVLDIPDDAEEGLTNIALMAMRGAEVLDPTADPNAIRPTMRDYEPLLKRMAELSGRAITSAHEALDDPDSFYPFVAFMMPVVMLTEPDGSGDDLLHAYLRALAPAIRGEGRQRNRLRELLEHGRKSAHRPREKLANVAVTPVAEFRLDDFEELRARLDRKPRVIRELVRVDRPRSDRLGHDAATASLAQVLEESHDARAPDLRYEAFLRGFPDGRGDVAPRPVQFAEEGRPVRREAVQPAAGLDVRRKAFDEPAIRELAQRAAHVHDPEGRLLGELARHLRFRGQGRQHLLAVAARHHEAEVQPDMASRLHWQLARSGTI